MRRREFIALIGGMVPWPLAARAQQAAIPVIGYLSPESAEFDLARLTGIRRGLTEAGRHGCPLAHSRQACLHRPPRQYGTEWLKYCCIATRGVCPGPLLHASSEQEIDTAFMTLGQLRADALVVGTEALFNSRSEQLAVLTLRHAVPAIYQYREFVSSGGLASFGTTVADTYRPLGVYTGRILNGEKPADLPVQQATKLDLIINIKTAKALGLTIPPSMLARADEVID